MKLVHHTIIYYYDLALGALQERNLPSFIEQLLEVTHQQEVEKDGFERLGTIDEIQTINDSIEYTQSTKRFITVYLMLQQTAYKNILITKRGKNSKK